MLACTQDVHARLKSWCTVIHASVLLALVSALISSIASARGSTSSLNAALMHASHWLLVVLLIVFYVYPATRTKPPTECLWLMYGFLLGELDSDSTAAWCCVCGSAMLYLYDQKIRVTESLNIMPAAEEPSHSAVTATPL